jgi:hypothetical protein
MNIDKITLSYYQNGLLTWLSLYISLKRLRIFQVFLRSDIFRALDGADTAAGWSCYCDKTQQKVFLTGTLFYPTLNQFRIKMVEW